MTVAATARRSDSKSSAEAPNTTVIEKNIVLPLANNIGVEILYGFVLRRHLVLQD